MIKYDKNGDPHFKNHHSGDFDACPGKGPHIVQTAPGRPASFLPLAGAVPLIWWAQRRTCDSGPFGQPFPNSQSDHSNQGTTKGHIGPILAAGHISYRHCLCIVVEIFLRILAESRWPSGWDSNVFPSAKMELYATHTQLAHVKSNCSKSLGPMRTSRSQQSVSFADGFLSLCLGKKTSSFVIIIYCYDHCYYYYILLLLHIVTMMISIIVTCCYYDD